MTDEMTCISLRQQRLYIIPVYQLCQQGTWYPCICVLYYNYKGELQALRGGICARANLYRLSRLARTLLVLKDWTFNTPFDHRCNKALVYINVFSNYIGTGFLVLAIGFNVNSQVWKSSAFTIENNYYQNSLR